MAIHQESDADESRAFTVSAQYLLRGDGSDGLRLAKPDEDDKPEEKPKRKTSQKAKKPTKPKTRKSITYILRRANGAVTVAPRGSRARPRGEFSVRGHYRPYRSGKVVWIAEYRKGTGKKKSKIYKMGGKKDDTDQ